MIMPWISKIYSTHKYNIKYYTVVFENDNTSWNTTK